jgi:hypothetical protein
MLVIGSDRLGSIVVEVDGETWYPIPGILVEVQGWKYQLYNLTYIPAAKRIQTQGVPELFNPSFTKTHALGGDGESSTVVIGMDVFVIDKDKCSRLNDLQFRWVDPNGKEGQ